MDFDTFAKLYAVLRVRVNRADDLLVDAIKCSDVEEMIDSNDDEEFELRLDKTHGTAWIEIHNPQRGSIIHAQANIQQRKVEVLSQTIDSIALLDMFENENLNGRETMEYYNARTGRTDPMAEYAETRSYAEKAARLIVAGIGSRPELSPEDHALVANEIIAILKDPTPFGFGARVQRVLAWAIHPETQAEWGFYVAAWVIQNVSYADYVDEAPLREMFDRFPALTSMSPT